MSLLRFLVAALLPLLVFTAPADPESSTRSRPSRARLILRGARPVFRGWFGPVSAGPTRSITLSAVTPVCPADFPVGFTVVCDTRSHTARSATFKVGGTIVKVARRSWYGPYEVAGYFRGGKIVWEGWATGTRVRCVLDNVVVARATIRVSC